ncbi:hypothetical protein AWP60_05865 [Escherichia coli]|nr:hypothetical protein AWP60_05865 [Escherichia coli]
MGERQGPIRHADCRQRKLADFLCTGGIIQGLIRRASVASGNGTALIVGCGATALFDLHTTHFPAKFAPHISLSINGFVTETIVFFYICLCHCAGYYSAGGHRMTCCTAW